MTHCGGCDFTVPGKPAPKGSMKGFVPKGTRRAILTASNRETLKPWEARIAYAAAEAWGGEPTELPVSVEMVFRLLRPRAHYGTGKNHAKLKLSAPRFPAVMPDIDKLTRAVLDGMTGVVFCDDKQVIHIDAQKNYGTPRVEVCVRTL